MIRRTSAVRSEVHSFYNNLTDNVNEVTNDAWMASFAKIDPAKLGGGLNKSGPGKSPTYLALSGKVRQAASLLSRLTGERGRRPKCRRPYGPGRRPLRTCRRERRPQHS